MVSVNNDNWYALPPDPNTWESVIIENLSRKIPEIPRYIAGVELSKFDPVMGEADGLVYLLSGMAAIPITIRQNRLAPLDVMITKKEEFYPVTETFLQKVYADNIIGQPSADPHMSEDTVADGPARQVRMYQTVDPVKKAALQEKIASSPSLLTFFSEHRPEMLAEILRPIEEEKVAFEVLTEDDIPEIHFLSKEAGRYFFNGEEITVKEASEFMDAVDLSVVERQRVMKGGCVCFDHREKHASVVVPVIDIGRTHQSDDERAEQDARANTFVATCLTVDGVPHRGYLHRTIKWLGPNMKAEHGYVFITDSFHSVQDDVRVLDSVPITLEDLKKASTHTDPMVGMCGVVIDHFDLEGPFEVSSVVNYGNIKVIRTLQHGLEPQEYTIGSDKLFFEVPSERKGLLRSIDSPMYVTPGKNMSVGLNGEGNIVLGNNSYSYANALYSAMRDLNITFDDALKVCDLAKTAGIANFKLAAAPEPEEDKEKAKKEVPAAQAQPAAQTQSPQVAQAPPVDPVNFEDIDDVAKVNDPNLMDAYLSGKLVDVNTAGREQMMKASDDLVGAIKSLGKLLYLARLGKIDYVKEEDAQIALNKLSDVARSIGVSSSQMF